MTPQPSAAPWRSIDTAVSAETIAEARSQCHYAAQFISRFGRGYLAHQEDDSHTSMTWSREHEALIGQPHSLQLAVRPRTLTLFLVEGPHLTAELPLAGQTVATTMTWLQQQLQERGLDPAPLARPLHYEIPDHSLAHGAVFRAAGLEPGLQTLAVLYRDTASLLESLRTANASPVRCWPHHFDIATLFTKEGVSVNAGLSPGDSDYPQPYFYVSPYPYPPAADLPRLTSGGAWHTSNWTGAVLRLDQLATIPSGQEQHVRHFFTEALRLLHA